MRAFRQRYPDKYMPLYYILHSLQKAPRRGGRLDKPRYFVVLSKISMILRWIVGGAEDLLLFYFKLMYSTTSPYDVTKGWGKRMCHAEAGQSG